MRCFNARHVDTIFKAHTTLATRLGQPLRELVSIAGLIVRRERPPHQRLTGLREGRIDRCALAGGLHPSQTPQPGHQLGLRNCVFELPWVGIDMQDATLLLVIVQIKLLAQRLQRGAAIEAEGNQRLDIGTRAGRSAFTQEAESPCPLRRIEAHTP